jgi:hypothetical protein
MSTKIDDLPGPSFSNEVHKLQNEVKQNYEYYEEINPNSSNIQVEKKRVRFAEPSDTHFNYTFSSELNEENLLLLAVLFIAALPSFTVYVTQLPFIGTYASGDVFTSFIKAALLLVIYMIVKIYVLPKIRI